MKPAFSRNARPTRTKSPTFVRSNVFSRGQKSLHAWALFAVVAALAIATAQAQTTAHAPQPSSLQPPAGSAVAGATSSLENLHQLSPTLYSGGEPHGDVAFSKLAELGVRTVVSVDGARPDVAAAKKHGLRYIHIPIGYDGVDPEAQAALTRVVREIEGPVFLHCHHGKHRGPAAAAVMCMAAGDMDAGAGARLPEARRHGRRVRGPVARRPRVQAAAGRRRAAGARRSRPRSTRSPPRWPCSTARGTA